MVTFGKKFSSTAAVACVWIGGSALVLLLYLGLSAPFARIPRPEGEGAALSLWAAVPMPLVAALGGTGALWLLRKSSGWPKLKIWHVFLRALGVAVFGLALLPVGSVMVIAVASEVLSLAGVAILTWTEASRGSLGTHLFAGSTVVGSDEKRPGPPGEKE